MAISPHPKIALPDACSCRASKPSELCSTCQLANCRSRKANFGDTSLNRLAVSWRLAKNRLLNLPLALCMHITHHNCDEQLLQVSVLKHTTRRRKTNTRERRTKMNHSTPYGRNITPLVLSEKLRTRNKGSPQVKDSRYVARLLLARHADLRDRGSLTGSVGLFGRYFIGANCA